MKISTQKQSCRQRWNQTKNFSFEPCVGKTVAAMKTIGNGTEELFRFAHDVLIVGILNRDEKENEYLP
jgi:hypothetical protein